MARASSPRHWSGYTSVPTIVTTPCTPSPPLSLSQMTTARVLAPASLTTRSGSLMSRTGSMHLPVTRALSADRIMSADASLSGTVSVPISARGSPSVPARASTPARASSPGCSSARTVGTGRSSLYPMGCESPSVMSVGHPRVSSLAALPRHASPSVSQMRSPPMRPDLFQTDSVTTSAIPQLSSASMLTEPPSLLDRLDRGLTDVMMQSSPVEESRQESELFQSFRETTDANLQAHSYYCESQFQLISDKIETLMASMDQSCKLIHQRLDESIEQRLEQMHKDVATAIANTHVVASVCEARCDKMATAADLADKEMRVLAAECKEFLKVISPTDIHESLRQLNSKVYKLEAAEIRNGHLLTSHSVVAEEELSKVRTSIAELSSQVQAEMGEGRSYAARIEELSRENGALRALENQLCDSVEGVVDAAGRAYTSRLRELKLNSGALNVTTSVDELQVDDDQWDEDLRVLSHNFAAATSAVELRAKSRNTHQKFSAAAGALRIGSLAPSAGAEQVQMPEPSVSFGPPAVEISSGVQTPSIPHQKLSATDIALRVSSLVSGAGVEQVQAPERGESLSPTLPVYEAVSLPLTPDRLGFSETRNPPETERHPRRMGTWPR